MWRNEGVVLNETCKDEELANLVIAPEFPRGFLGSGFTRLVKRESVDFVRLLESKRFGPVVLVGFSIVVVPSFCFGRVIDGPDGRSDDHRF